MQHFTLPCPVGQMGVLELQADRSSWKTSPEQADLELISNCLSQAGSNMQDNKTFFKLRDAHFLQCVQRAVVCAAAVQAWELTAFCFSLPAGDVSLHLTTFSLQYTPPVVACVCIHLACKWSNWEIPVSTDGKHWWEYVDGTVTLELLDGKFGARPDMFPYTVRGIPLTCYLISKGCAHQGF